MQYWVDGYNLLFQTRGDFQSFQQARTEVIRDLHLFCRYLQVKIVVIFDAHMTPLDEERRDLKPLEILFTKEHETADNCLINKLKHTHKPQNVIIVTSDKPLARSLRMMGGQVEPIESFMDIMHKRLLNRLKAPVLVKKDLKIIKAEKPLPREGSLEYYQNLFDPTVDEGIPIEKHPSALEVLKNEVVVADHKESELDRYMRIFSEAAKDLDKSKPKRKITKKPLNYTS